MPEYKVRVSALPTEMTITVEANSGEEAEEFAKEKAYDYDIFEVRAEVLSNE